MELPQPAPTTPLLGRRGIGAIVAGVLALSTLAACSSSDDAADDAGEEATPSTEVADGGTVDRGVPARPSPGCDAASPLEAGVAVDRTTHDGEEREYAVLVPEQAQEGPVPLVLDLHGLGSNREQQQNLSGYQALAERDGAAVVWPQGLGERPSWNTVPGRGADDAGFLVALIAQLGEQLCIDEARVYSSGISNGGLMSSALGCDHSDVIAAVAPVAGFLTTPDCADPSPLILFYGTDDAVLPWAGGVGAGLGAVGSDEVPDLPEPAEPDLTADPGLLAPVPVNLAEWADRAGCDPEPVEESVTDEVARSSYEGCASGDVELYLVEGGGHTWPGAEGMRSLEDPVIAEVIGYTTTEISASELAWEFFGEHALG